MVPMTTGIAITNDLARVAGLIAIKHPDCSVQIEWNEGAPENVWLVTATNGVEDTIYVVDDESGTWAPATDEELQLAGRR